jgi:hypothetical protein
MPSVSQKRMGSKLSSYAKRARSERMTDRINEIPAERGRRGRHEGIIPIFSARERRRTSDPRHNQETGSTYFKLAQTKRLVSYFYFIDKRLGLCFFKGGRNVFGDFMRKLVFFIASMKNDISRKMLENRSKVATNFS